MVNIVLVLSCLGVVQALLLCAYLFSLKDKKANIVLACMLLALVMVVGKSVASNYMMVALWLRNLGIAGKLLTGPFLWLYGKILFERRDFSQRDFIHIIPFILYALFCWAIPNATDFTSYLMASLVFAHLAVYLLFCWRYILNNLQGARLLPWYRNIVLGVTILWFLYVGIFVGVIPVYILGAVFFSFLIYIFSYLLLKRHVFNLQKYTNTAMSTEASANLLKHLKQLFEEKEIYLDSAISVKSVAEGLGVSPREVSQVINESVQMNFSEFVNYHRIVKAKSLLAHPDYWQQKIESIAYDCGFGNVTSFNLAFKADTGLTPSQYRNQFKVA
ncbi:helix-turn-helix domain-containing protein [Ohtaekwangia kribbensis]|uniref:Helix-turn-helix domain-containing protein n=1 Tax=Ohtaekwangia kribbensis TaxID=688913 RepID=A0ABW3K0P5_9BACT